MSTTWYRSSADRASATAGGGSHPQDRRSRCGDDADRAAATLRRSRFRPRVHFRIRSGSDRDTRGRPTACTPSRMFDPPRKIIWMFWEQGWNHLVHVESRRAHGKFSQAARCVEYWRRLNPDYTVHVLNSSSAAAMSPSYRDFRARNLGVPLQSDVLRLEVLSTHGGVWADVKTCPVQPLDWFASNFSAANGFFAWHGPRSAGTRFSRARTCFNEWHDFFRQAQYRPGMLNIDTWFLISPRPHHPLVDAWLEAVKAAAAGLPDNAKPPRYTYHFVHCVFNMLYADNRSIQKLYDQVPNIGYCEQHGGNAVETWLCAKVPRNGIEMAAMQRRDVKNTSADRTPDPTKFMYKGFGPVQRMNVAAYDAWVARWESTAAHR